MFKCIEITILVALASVTVQGQIAGGITRVVLELGKIIAEDTRKAGVLVENQSTWDAQLFCQSKDDRIGPPEGINVKPGEALGWSFRNIPFGRTLFWCAMNWNGQRVAWDVYRGGWKDAPNPAKWSIQNHGVLVTWQNNRIERPLKFNAKKVQGQGAHFV